MDTLCPNAAGVQLIVDITEGEIPFVATYTYAGGTYPSGAISEQTYTTTLPLNHRVCNGKDTVYLSLTDANNCTARDTAVFVIADLRGPVITGTLPDITIACRSELPAAMTTVAQLRDSLVGAGAGITDNCYDDIDKLQLSSVTDDITALCNTTYHRTYTVTDSCGNYTSIVQNIVFNDTDRPVVTGTLANDTIYADASCHYSVTNPFTTISQLNAHGVNVTDCNLKDTISFADSDSDPINSCSKEITRTYTVYDSCGNTATITQTIVVMDTVAPSVAMVLDTAYTYYYYNKGHCEYAQVPAHPQSFFDADITDCNDVTMEVSYRDTINGGEGCRWSYIRVYSFVDVCGNGPTEVRQPIVVRDTTRPVVTTALNDTILYYSGNSCTPATLPELALGDFAFEDCNEVTTMEVSYRDTINGGTGCEWSYVRVFSFKDACGNGPTEVSQTITVRDTTRPAISGTLESITIYKLADCNYILPDTLDMNSLDAAGLDFSDCNLRMDTVAVTHSPFVTIDNCSGQLIRTYEVFDRCGTGHPPRTCVG